MDMGWDSAAARTFATNVGLITSLGTRGPNIMSAEWTHQLSHTPGIIAVCIGMGKITVENIRATKEFGVNICAHNQATLASVSGNYHGDKVDKIAALTELGFHFVPAKKITPPMVKGVSLQAECILQEEHTIGDHVMFIGEVIHSQTSPTAPLVYHDHKYWELNQNIRAPSEEARAKIKEVVLKHPR